MIIPNHTWLAEKVKKDECTQKKNIKLLLLVSHAITDRLNAESTASQVICFGFEKERGKRTAIIKNCRIGLFFYSYWHFACKYKYQFELFKVKVCNRLKSLTYQPKYIVLQTVNLSLIPTTLSQIKSTDGPNQTPFSEFAMALQQHTVQPHFVLVPFFAQGHMIPVIVMARVLTHRGVLVTLVSTPNNASRFEKTLFRAAVLVCRKNS